MHTRPCVYHLRVEFLFPSEFLWNSAIKLHWSSKSDSLGASHPLSDSKAWKPAVGLRTFTPVGTSSVPRRVFPKAFFFPPASSHQCCSSLPSGFPASSAPPTTQSYLSFFPPTQSFLHSAVRVMAFKISVRDHHSYSISANSFPFYTG